MKFDLNAKVLILAPHTDDAEFGCGGSISKFSENKMEIMCVAFSAAEQSIPEGLPPDTNRNDMYKAMTTLGVDASKITILNYPVRNFPEYRQAILDDLIKINRDFEPDIVFLPSTFDTHQDHQVISQEGFRAFKKTSILGYELPWNNLMFTTTCFISLEERHVEKKLKSLECYIAQMGRDYISSDFIRSVLRTRGGQTSRTFAEAFQVIRINF